MNKKFKYTCETPCHATIEGKEISMFAGNEYSLPCDNRLVKTMVAAGQLVEIETASKPSKK